MTTVEKALKAIADGYEYRIQPPMIEKGWFTGFIAVDNPDFRKDDGLEKSEYPEYVRVELVEKNG